MVREARPMAQTTANPLSIPGSAGLAGSKGLVGTTRLLTEATAVSVAEAPPAITDAITDASPAGALATAQRIDRWTGGDPNLHYSVLSPSVAPTDAAQRPTLVMVHGLEHRGECWLSTATLLVERHGFTVILLDLRGHGLSQWSCSVSQATYPQYIADVERALDDYRQVAIQEGRTDAPIQFALVGHSMGGPVVEGVARRRAVAGLYLLATVTPSQFFSAVWRSLAGFFWHHLLGHPQHLLGVLTGHRRMFDTATVTRRYLLGVTATQQQVDELLRQLGPESIRAVRGILLQGMRDSWHLLHHPDYLRPMNQVQTIRVVAAGNDALMHPSVAAKSAQLLNASFRVLPGLPHDAMRARANGDELEGEALTEDLALFADRIGRAVIAGADDPRDPRDTSDVGGTMRVPVAQDQKG